MLSQIGLIVHRCISMVCLGSSHLLGHIHIKFITQNLIETLIGSCDVHLVGRDFLGLEKLGSSVLAGFGVGWEVGGSLHLVPLLTRIVLH